LLNDVPTSPRSWTNGIELKISMSGNTPKVHRWRRECHVEKATHLLPLYWALLSQPKMAEGWARYLGGDKIEAQSTGVETHGLSPRAVFTMKEAGADISYHSFKHIDHAL
jgi:hypothetical protein